MRKMMLWVACWAVSGGMGLFGGWPAEAGDWPQYRGDSARSGYSGDALADGLTLWWTFETGDGLDPAWEGEDTRMEFDHAAGLSVAGGRVYFGQSVDCNIYSIDANSGAVMWRYTTDAPVRFAPGIFEGWVFAVSDDGYLYCLDGDSGALQWHLQGGPGPERPAADSGVLEVAGGGQEPLRRTKTDQQKSDVPSGGAAELVVRATPGPPRPMVLGNDRMVSRWPARGGVAIEGGLVYFGAGIWPSEGIYLRAVDGRSGEVKWVNDVAGLMEMDQPHGTARARSGLSAQGYLVVSGDALLVPTGRAVPAALNRVDGSFRYFHLQGYGRWGGASVQALDGCFVNVGAAYDVATGTKRVALPVEGVAVARNGCLFEGADVGGVPAGELVVERDAVDRMGQPTTKLEAGEPVWTVDLGVETNGALIAAGDVVVAGAGHEVVAFDTGAKKVVWRHAFEGRPLELAAAGGCLYVSTDAGRIYCFGAPRGGEPGVVRPERGPVAGAKRGPYARAAEAILKKTGYRRVLRGFGCGRGNWRWSWRFAASWSSMESTRTRRRCGRRGAADAAGSTGRG